MGLLDREDLYSIRFDSIAGVWGRKQGGGELCCVSHGREESSTRRVVKNRKGNGEAGEADFPSKSECKHTNIKQASSANIRISIWSMKSLRPDAMLKGIFAIISTPFRPLFFALPLPQYFPSPSVSHSPPHHPLPSLPSPPFLLPPIHPPSFQSPYNPPSFQPPYNHPIQSASPSAKPCIPLAFATRSITVCPAGKFPSGGLARLTALFTTNAQLSLTISFRFSVP